MIAAADLLQKDFGVAADKAGEAAEGGVPRGVAEAGDLLLTRTPPDLDEARLALQAIVSSLILWYFTGFCPMVPRLSAMTGVAFVLFTFYMVTDPATTPERPGAQVAFGASVALVYSFLIMSHVVFGLFVALVIVCVARGLGMYLLACWRDKVTG